MKKRLNRATSKKKTPPIRQGQKKWFERRCALAYVQLAPDDTGQTKQPSCEQAERSRLGNEHVRVTAGDTGTAIEEAFARVDSQLHRHAVGPETAGRFRPTAIAQ